MIKEAWIGDFANILEIVKRPDNIPELSQVVQGLGSYCKFQS